MTTCVQKGYNVTSMMIAMMAYSAASTIRSPRVFFTLIIGRSPPSQNLPQGVVAAAEPLDDLVDDQDERERDNGLEQPDGGRITVVHLDEPFAVHIGVDDVRHVV